MKFGRTMQDRVREEWRNYAVDYKALKRIIDPPGTPTEEEGDYSSPVKPTDDDDGRAAAAAQRRDSAELDSTYRMVPKPKHKHGEVDAESKEEFFRIYERSKDRIRKFHEDREAWAAGRAKALTSKVEGQMQRRWPSDADDDYAAAEDSEHDREAARAGLMKALDNFDIELDLALEFLALNKTAFSKILKKYDKRTYSKVRESRLEELKETHPFLDGSVLLSFKDRVSDLRARLDESEHFEMEQESELAHEEVRMEEEKKNEGLPLAVRVREETAEAEKGKEKGEEAVAAVVVPAVDAAKTPSTLTERIQRARKQYRRKTREERALERMFDRVQVELRLQVLHSPFFAGHQARTLPHFKDDEMKIGPELGVGEFCAVNEVREFDVPESCHICFLHRGYNDPQQSNASKSSLSANTVSVVLNPSIGADDRDRLGADNGPGPGGGVVPIQSQRSRLISGEDYTFVIDDNISDYDDLESDHEDEDESETRGFMKDHALREGSARYAIKRVKKELKGDAREEAAVDVAREARFLSCLDNPNIIKMRATCGIPGHPKYCLILDRLYDTLDTKCQKWSRAVKRSSGKLLGLVGKQEAKINDLWSERLIALYDIAHAMNYLHSFNIMHRDIKLQNVGFDIRGDLKLFDFGLAKELLPRDKVGTDQYRASGVTGTRRYMSPEVAQCRPYGLSADVYSFAILFWEVLALKVSFKGYDHEKHLRQVLYKNKRPKIPSSWPPAVKDLLSQCWSPDPSARPNFSGICKRMRRELSVVTDVGFSERSDDLMNRSITSRYG